MIEADTDAQDAQADRIEADAEDAQIRADSRTAAQRVRLRPVAWLAGRERQTGEI